MLKFESAECCVIDRPLIEWGSSFTWHGAQDLLELCFTLRPLIAPAPLGACHGHGHQPWTLPLQGPPHQRAVPVLLRAPKYGPQLAEHVRSLVASALAPQRAAPSSDEVAQVRGRDR